MQQPRRIRLNQELRNKINPRFRVHLEAEDTQERRKFHDLRNSFKELQDKSWPNLSPDPSGHTIC